MAADKDAGVVDSKAKRKADEDKEGRNKIEQDRDKRAETARHVKEKKVKDNTEIRQDQDHGTDKDTELTQELTRELAQLKTELEHNKTETKTMQRHLKELRDTEAEGGRPVSLRCILEIMRGLF